MFLYTINIQSNIFIFTLYEESKVKSLQWSDLTLLHSYILYMNITHLCAQDVYHDTCPQSFQLQSDANFMPRLQTTTRWDMLVAKPHIFHNSLVFIYSTLDIRSLSLYKTDVLLYYNIKTTHILHFNEMHFDTLT
jgi:hypothetical protein